MQNRQEPLAPGAVSCAGLKFPGPRRCTGRIHDAVAVSPFRHMVTPRWLHHAVAMTNCLHGRVGNERGYLYAPDDPSPAKPWPPMPAVFQALCHDAAVEATLSRFSTRMPACINRYGVEAKLSLHQDKR